MVSERSELVREVRRKVVEAATRLFASRGFGGTAVQDVAGVVGITKGAILHHFGSKEELRVAVLEDIVTHWRDALPRLLLAATASEDRFDAVVGELRRFFAEDPDRARVVMRELLDRPAEARSLLKTSVRPWLEAVAGYIRTGQARGRHYADVDAEAYVLHVMLLVIAATASEQVTTSLLGGDASRADAEVRRIAKAALFAPQAHAQKGSAAKRSSRRRAGATSAPRVKQDGRT